MAKIAVQLERALAQRALNGGPGHPRARVLARGDRWAVEDVVCTSGPKDRPFDERHSRFAIAVVVAGSFQYRSHSRSGASRELMTPGSLLLGNVGQHFECAHEHGAGDRCLAFHYATDCFETLMADAGAHGTKPHFRMLRVPPLRALSPLVAQACAGLSRSDVDDSLDVGWEELGVRLAVQTIQLVHGLSPDPSRPSAGAVARVTRVVRMIQSHHDVGVKLGALAHEAGLSPYHFLRTFERVTGVTPHQYILRARLREAAMRLADPATPNRSPSAAHNIRQAKVLDIALDCGFGDLSNFNRAFHAEFGVSPRVYRATAGSSALSSSKLAFNSARS
ncbi:MAG: helix-turn-helix transcriptional regulator [Bryobacteraceae bacterium]